MPSSKCAFKQDFQHNVGMRNWQGSRSATSLSTRIKFSRAEGKRERKRSVQKQRGVRERHRMQPLPKNDSSHSPSGHCRPESPCQPHCTSPEELFEEKVFWKNKAKIPWEFSAVLQQQSEGLCRTASPGHPALIPPLPLTQAPLGCSCSLTATKACLQ